MPEPERPPRKGAGRNLPMAIATGLILAGLILGTLYTSRLAWFVVVSAAVLVAQWELYRALDGRGYRPALYLGMAAGAVLLIGSYMGGTGALSFGLTMTVLATLVWFIPDARRAGVADRVSATLLGVVYVPFMAAHVVLMRDLPDGIAVTICYIGIVAFYDIGAYAAGSMFGKHLMAPSVSPKKTWEGAAGATVLVFVLALVLGPILGPFTALEAAALAAIAAVAAPLGDLAESLVKRDLQVKDMGTLLPGHGGVFDRIDALLMVAPAAYWFVRTVVF
jgi:phosphatidate cytidylyltransferase